MKYNGTLFKKEEGYRLVSRLKSSSFYFVFLCVFIGYHFCAFKTTLAHVVILVFYIKYRSEATILACTIRHVVVTSA